MPTLAWTWQDTLAWTWQETLGLGWQPGASVCVPLTRFAGTLTVQTPPVDRAGVSAGVSGGWGAPT